MPIFRPEGSVLSAQGNALGIVLECSSALKGPFNVQRLCDLILLPLNGERFSLKRPHIGFTRGL